MQQFEPQKSPTQSTSAQIEFYRPIEALSILAGTNAPGNEAYKKLEGALSTLPGFLRISESALTEAAKKFEHVVNITGFSGQEVHPGQIELLKVAYEAIFFDKGWRKEDTMLISGGTALGVPHSAVPYLATELGYTAFGVMALPGVAYTMSPGYRAICAENSWVNWGDEAETMAKVSNATLLVGGGVQALGDALKSLRDGEPIAIIVNAFNGMARIEYEQNGLHGDAILRSKNELRPAAKVAHVSDLKTSVTNWLQSQKQSEEAAQTAKVTGLPVSGLVTEIKGGVRRACAQDLMYFAITGDAELLPKEYRPETAEQTEALRSDLVAHLDLYYLLDDPHEGVLAAAVLRLNDALKLENIEILGQVIDHAVEHDVHNPVTGNFGPPTLGAKTPKELARRLKDKLTQRLQDGNVNQLKAA